MLDMSLFRVLTRGAGDLSQCCFCIYISQKCDTIRTLTYKMVTAIGRPRTRQTNKQSVILLQLSSITPTPCRL